MNDKDIEAMALKQRIEVCMRVVDGQGNSTATLLEATPAQLRALCESFHAAALAEALKKVPHILRWEQDCTTIEGSMVPNPDGQWAEYWPCAEAIATLQARIKELEAEALALRMKYISAFGQVQENGRE